VDARCNLQLSILRPNINKWNDKNMILSTLCTDFTVVLDGILVKALDRLHTGSGR
jgi:hypothetical protein